MNAERLLRSMRCIHAWAIAAVEGSHTIGNNYLAVLDAIATEAATAIGVETANKEGEQ